jgi:hypothetical protein
MKTISQSQLKRNLNRACRVGDIVIFDVLGAAPRGSGATEAAAREHVRRAAETLKAPYEAFNGAAHRVRGLYRASRLPSPKISRNMRSVGPKGMRDREWDNHLSIVLVV